MQKEHFVRNALTMHPVESVLKKILLNIFTCEDSFSGTAQTEGLGGGALPHFFAKIEIN